MLPGKQPQSFVWPVCRMKSNLFGSNGGSRSESQTRGLGDEEMEEQLERENENELEALREKVPMHYCSVSIILSKFHRWPQSSQLRLISKMKYERTIKFLMEWCASISPVSRFCFDIFMDLINRFVFFL